MEHDEYVSEGYACDEMGIDDKTLLIFGTHFKSFVYKTLDLVSKAKQRYEANSLKKVGELCTCPSCGKDFKKKSYQQKFHSTRCKDIYWNSVDDTRRERAKFYNR